MKHEQVSTVYKNTISNFKLKEDEKYCVCCDLVIKKTNFTRHDNSMKHEKAVLTFLKRMHEEKAEDKQQIEARTANRLARKQLRQNSKSQ